MRTAIVIPTLGNRPDYLELTLKSVRSAGDCYLAIVKPENVQIDVCFDKYVDAQFDEKGLGLAAAINEGLNSVPREFEFINWIGDDDLLMPDSISNAEYVLRSHSDSVLVYGQCVYINEAGGEIGTNRSGRFASTLMRFGPCLIPQPGSLIRRESLQKVGMLNENLRFAFDLDLFLNLRRMGRLTYLPRVLSAFRWHSSSLTVSERSRSIEESKQVRVQHLGALAKKISPLWELPGTKASEIAGRLVSLRGRATRSLPF